MHRATPVALGSTTTGGRAAVPRPGRTMRIPHSQRLWWCAALLLVSVGARLSWGFLTPNGLNFVDLHVYVDGAASLLHGNLYDFTYSQDTPDFPLPFTYPPFAAMVFFPLHYLPFGVVGLAWQLLTVVALYGIVRIALELLVGTEARNTRWTCVALAWTAIGVWTEPVRMTLDYGQVNVFLVLGAIFAVRSSRWWLSGFLVGFVAGRNSGRHQTDPCDCGTVLPRPPPLVRCCLLRGRVLRDRRTQRSGPRRTGQDVLHDALR